MRSKVRKKKPQRILGAVVSPFGGTKKKSKRSQSLKNELKAFLSNAGQVDIRTPWVLRLMAVVSVLILSMLIL